MTTERSKNVATRDHYRLELRLLGAPTVWLHGELVRFRSRKVLALLAFLAVEGGVHRRESLVELLWPDSDGTKGATTLRSTLSRLRESLGGAADVLVSDSAGVRIALSDVDAVDVHRLGALAEAADTSLTEADDVPTGRFLEGFGVDGSAELDDWVSRWSATCHGQQTTLYERMSTRALEHGRLAVAGDIAAQWHSLAPFDDGPVACLVEVDARRGNRVSALDRYARHREVLAEELEARPGSSLRALVDRVRDGDLAHSSPGEALRHHLDEGSAALERDEARAALAALDQAVLLLDAVGPADTAELTLPVLETRARALELCQRFEAARDDYQGLVDRADEHHELTWRLHGLVGLAVLHATPTALASSDLAARHAEAAIDLARLLGDDDSEARAWWAMLLVAHYGRGDEDAALEHGLRGVTAARASARSAMLPRLLNDLHWVHAARGDLGAADETLREAISCWEQLGDHSMLADSLNGAVLLTTLRGDFEEAAAFAARGDQLARDGRNLWNQLAINANLGLLRRETGEYDRGISALRAASDIAADGMPAARAFYQLTLAILLGDLGLADSVETLCIDVEAHVGDLPGFWRVPGVLDTLRIRTRVQTGVVDVADLDRVEEIASGPVGLSLTSVLAPPVACATARRLDQPDRALSIGKRYLESAERATVRLGAPEILLIMASAHLDLGAGDDASTCSRNAIAAADEIGSRRLRWQQHAVVARLHRAAGNGAAADGEDAADADGARRAPLQRARPLSGELRLTHGCHHEHERCE